MDHSYQHLEPFFGSWYIDELIGEGSFGKVFKIKRKGFGKDQYSALKIIQIPQTEAEIKRAYSEGMDEESATAYFESFVTDITKEIELMDILKGNTNIVSYEDHQIIKKPNGIGWTILIRMELLTSLPDYITQHQLSQLDVLRLATDICRALELCQKNRIIHRDIKPDNIFVSVNGDYKLGDFGIARQLEKTMSGLSKKGTYTYMAPEVYLGKPYNATVDIYSLGIVMYRLLNNNRAPFIPDYPAAITFADREKAQNMQMSGEAMPLPKNADPRLAAVVMKACSYNPQDRYSSPAAFIEALSGIFRDVFPADSSILPMPVMKPSFSETVDNEKIATASDSDGEKNAGTVGTVGMFGTVGGRYTAVVPTGGAEAPSTTAEFTDNTVKGAVGNTGVQSEKDIKKSRKKPALVVVIAAALVLLVGLSAYGLNRLGVSKETTTSSSGTTNAQTITKSAETAVVPNIVGKTSDDAVKLLAEKGFNGDITHVYDDKVAAGIVISQKSPEGAKLQKGATVGLIVSKGKETQTVPYLTGKTAQAASDELQALGFVFASKTQVDDNKTAGTVIGQSVAAGKQLKRGQTVTVTVCVASTKVSVPNLIGKTADEAESALKKAGLAYSSTSRFSISVKNGVVISQDKSAGTQLATGSVVEFVVSKGIDYRVVPYMVGKTLADAQSALTEAGLKSDITEQFSGSVVSGRVISQGTPAGDELAVGSTVTLFISKGVDYRTVPSLVGKTAAEAEAALTAVGLKSAKTEQYSDTVPSGKVISQGTTSGTKLAVGSTVAIVVSKGVDYRMVPNLVNKTSSEAVAALSAVGLQCSQTQQYSSSVPAGKVISQGTPAGTKLAVGSTVAIVVSKGIDYRIVPNLVNKTSSEAVAALSAVGLQCSQTQQYSNSVPAGKVISQGTSAGTNLPVGSTVSIIVSKGPEMVTVPNLNGMSRANAEAALNAAGLSVGSISQPYRYQYAYNTVFEQGTPAGTSVARGSPVNLSISNGAKPFAVGDGVDFNGGSLSSAAGLYGSNHEASYGTIAQLYYYGGALWIRFTYFGNSVPCGWAPASSFSQRTN